MKFRYQEDYDKLNETCPPYDYKALNIEAFRWVFSPIEQDDNFISQYHKKPKRFNKKRDIEKCKAMALSMFKTKVGAIKRFRELMKFMGDDAHLELGSNIAMGQIEECDGVNEIILTDGHFNHHPHEATDYAKKFQITYKL